MKTYMICCRSPETGEQLFVRDRTLDGARLQASMLPERFSVRIEKTADTEQRFRELMDQMGVEFDAQNRSKRWKK